jgi:hypothetical protein
LNNPSTKDPAYKVTQISSRLRSGGDPHPIGRYTPKELPLKFVPERF